MRDASGGAPQVGVGGVTIGIVAGELACEAELIAAIRDAPGC